jgi:hypothetical protein
VSSGESDDPGCPPATCRNVCVQLPGTASIVGVQGYAKEPTQTVWTQCHQRGYGNGSWLDCGELGSCSFPRNGKSAIRLNDAWQQVCWNFKNWSGDRVRDARLVVTWASNDPNDLPAEWEQMLEWCSIDAGAPDCPNQYADLGLTGCLTSVPRPCLIREAVKVARNQPQLAFRIARACQCHNTRAVRILDVHEGEVIEWLKSRTPDLYLSSQRTS